MIQESSEANTSRPIVDAKSGSRCKKNSNPETHVDKKNQRTPQRPIIPFVTTRKKRKDMIRLATETVEGTWRRKC